MEPITTTVANVVTICDSIINHTRNLKQRYKDYKNYEQNFEKLRKYVERCKVVYTNLDGIYNQVAANISKQLKGSYQVLILAVIDKLKEITWFVTSESDRVQPEASDRVQSEASDRAQPEASDRVQPEASDRAQPEASDRAQPEATDRVQSEASSSFRGKIKQFKKKFTRFSSASKVATEMEKLSNELSQILNQCVERTEFLESKIGDEYGAKFIVPELGDVVLDLNDVDAPEGRLKAQVLKGGSITSAVGGAPSESANCSGASGDITSVDGMGGIGKTVALKALANDIDITNKFKDGIYFMTFGSDASELKAVGQVGDIVKQSGGEIMSKEISSLSLEKAMSMAVEWFKGRTALFVCDDLWPTKNDAYGFLRQLKRLSKCSDTCHLVLSTRSEKLARVACERENVITFTCLDATGHQARKIFINDAKLSDVMYEALLARTRDIVDKILTKCGGHCLALAVAGGGVGEMISKGRTVHRAVEEYATLLNEDMSNLIENDGPIDYSNSVFRCFEISLSLVNELARFKQIREKFSDRFNRLCIFEKKSRITAAMLNYAWGTQLNLVSIQKLTDLKLLNAEGNMYSFHDLLHDFCIGNAAGNVPSYHRDVLNRIVGQRSERNCNQLCTSRVEEGTWSSTCASEAGGLEWWKVRVGNDVEEYLFSNLARHLRYGELRAELTMLLTRFEWTVFRFRRKERNYLMYDFENWFSMGGGIAHVNEMKQLRQAIVLSWARSVNSNTVSELATHMHAYFLDLPGNLQLVNRYGKSVHNTDGLGVWMKPLSRIWPLILPGQSIIDVGTEVYGLAFNWETNQGVVACNDKILYLDFDTLTFWTKMEIPRVFSKVAWRKMGKEIVYHEGDNIVVFDLQTKKIKQHICVSEWIPDFAWTVSDDGRFICTGGIKLRLYDIESGGKVVAFGGYVNKIVSVAFSPDGKRIVSGSVDGTVLIWDAASANGIHVLLGHNMVVTSVAFSLDGLRIVSGSYDGTLKIWDASSGNQISVLSQHRTSLTSVAFSLDGERIVSGSSDGTVRIWDAASGNQISVLHGHRDVVRSVAFSPDGERIVSGSEDNTVRIWDAKLENLNSEPRGPEQEMRCMAISPDGRRRVSIESKMMKIWDGKSENPIFAFAEEGKCFASVAFSPDGERIVSTFYDRRYKIDGERMASFSSIDYTFRIYNAETGNKITDLFVLEDEEFSVVFSPDGKRIAFGLEDGTVKLYDAASGKQISVLRGYKSWITSVAFSPDGRCIVSGCDEKTLRVWDLETADSIYELCGHEREVCSVAFSPDGQRIVSGSADQTVRIWDVEKRDQISVLCDHEGTVHNVAFSHDGERVVSASYKTVIVWEVGLRNNAQEQNEGQHNQLLCQVTLPSYCMCVAITNDIGREVIVAGLENNQIVRFELVR